MSIIVDDINKQNDELLTIARLRRELDAAIAAKEAAERKLDTVALFGKNSDKAERDRLSAELAKFKDSCSGCGASNCSALWIYSRKCCPDCSHKKTEEVSLSERLFALAHQNQALLSELAEVKAMCRGHLAVIENLHGELSAAVAMAERNEQEVYALMRLIDRSKPVLEAARKVDYLAVTDGTHVEFMSALRDLNTALRAIDAAKVSVSEEKPTCAEHPGKDCIHELEETISELEESLQGMTTDRDSWKNLYDAAFGKLTEAKAERDSWKARHLEATEQYEQLREKLAEAEKREAECRAHWELSQGDVESLMRQLRDVAERQRQSDKAFVRGWLEGEVVLPNQGAEAVNFADEALSRAPLIADTGERKPSAHCVCNTPGPDECGARHGPPENTGQPLCKHCGKTEDAHVPQYDAGRLCSPSPSSKLFEPAPPKSSKGACFDERGLAALLESDNIEPMASGAIDEWTDKRCDHIFGRDHDITELDEACVAIKRRNARIAELEEKLSVASSPEEYFEALEGMRRQDARIKELEDLAETRMRCYEEAESERLYAEGESSRLRAKCTRQRRELRRLNSSIRLWAFDGECWKADAKECRRERDANAAFYETSTASHKNRIAELEAAARDRLTIETRQGATIEALREEIRALKEREASRSVFAAQAAPYQSPVRESRGEKK